MCEGWWLTDTMVTKIMAWRSIREGLDSREGRRLDSCLACCAWPWGKPKEKSGQQARGCGEAGESAGGSVAIDGRGAERGAVVEVCGTPFRRGGDPPGQIAPEIRQIQLIDDILDR